MSEPALIVNELVKDYRSGVRAVDGLSFRVAEGEVFALLGPNGAGKSTTIKTIATLLRPTSGEVHVCGHEVQGSPDAVRACLGYVPQELALDRHLTGRQHLQLSARMYRIPKAEMGARIDEILNLVELSDRAGDSIRQYSGGMKKRLDLACGLLHRPKLLILDEPTVGLDIQTRNRIWSFVAGLRERGTTVLLTTHDMDEADHLSDRIAIVDHGKLQAEGTGTELKQTFGGDMVRVEMGRTTLTDAQRESLRGLEGVSSLEERGRSLLFVTDSGKALAPRVADWLEENLESGPRSLSFGLPSLGDVFLKITGHAIRDEAA